MLIDAHGEADWTQGVASTVSAGEKPSPLASAGHWQQIFGGGGGNGGGGFGGGVMGGASMQHIYMFPDVSPSSPMHQSSELGLGTTW